MKLLITLLTVLISLNAYAKKDDDKQNRAQRLFDSMTAEEAMASNKFTKRGWNINIPGTSTWYSPSGLCLTHDSIQTTTPRTFCTEWTVNLDEAEFGRYTAVFSSYSRAKRKAEGSNGKGKPYCTDSFEKIVSAPRVSMVERCVAWGVKLEDSSKIKRFSTRSQARRYAENSSKARGSEFCMEEGMVKRVVPTTYKVDFYRKTAHDRYDRKKLLGRHIYPIQSCN